MENSINDGVNVGNGVFRTGTGITRPGHRTTSKHRDYRNETIILSRLRRFHPRGGGGQRFIANRTVNEIQPWLSSNYIDPVSFRYYHPRSFLLSPGYHRSAYAWFLFTRAHGVIGINFFSVWRREQTRAAMVISPFPPPLLRPSFASTPWTLICGPAEIVWELLCFN